jgi:hypothetical protein
MSAPDQFPQRSPSAVSVTTALSDGLAEVHYADTTVATLAPASWPPVMWPTV